MDKKAAEKKERLLQALDQGMVMIHLDARRPGVLVPPNLRGEAHLRLNLSYRFDPPDLSVGDWGVRSTLSFSGSKFTVAVPWSALFAITSHATKEFWMYPDDMPEELIQQTVPPPAETRGDGRATPSARGMLREVVYQPEAAPPPHASGEESSTAPPLPSDGDPSATVTGPGPAAVPAPAPAPAPAAPVDGPQDDPPRPRGRAHLRLVK